MLPIWQQPADVGKGCTRGGPRCGGLRGMAATATAERAAGWGVAATAATVATVAKATEPVDVRRRRGLQRRRRRWPCTIVIGDRCDATFAQTISPGWYSRPPAHTQGTRYATESTASKTALSAVQSRIQVGMPGTGTTWGPLRMGVGRANLWRALDATPARMPFRPAEHACHPRDAEKRGRSSSHGGPLE